MITLLTILFLIAISFFCTAGVVWLICWGLTASGLLAISFSWPLAVAVWFILFLLKATFNITIKN